MCVASVLQHGPPICFISMSGTHTHTHCINGRYFTFHSNVMVPHLRNTHLILSLWQVSTNVWCRADGLLCVQGFVWENVNMECIIVTEDLGDWPLWKTNYICSAFLCLAVFPQMKLESENLPKTTAERSWGRVPDVSSLSTAIEGIPWACISFPFPQFPRRNRRVSACFDNKLYLIRSDLHPDT